MEETKGPEYRYQSGMRRVLAYGIDNLLFLGAVLVGLLMMASIYLALSSLNVPIIIVFFATVIPPVLFVLSFELFNRLVLPVKKNGKTIGKAIMGIRIISIEGKLGKKQMIIRWLALQGTLLLSSFVGGIAVIASAIVMANSKKSQSIHDQIAKTSVVLDGQRRETKLKGCFAVFLLLALLAVCGIITSMLTYANDARIDKEYLGRAVYYAGEDLPLRLKMQFEEVDSLIQAERFEEARRTINKMYPDNTYMAVQLKQLHCRILTNLDNALQAQTVCRELLNQSPYNISGLIGFSVASMQRGECDKANETAELGAQLYYGDVATPEEERDILGTLGLVLVECSGDADLARKSLTKALEGEWDAQTRELIKEYLAKLDEKKIQ